jgi:hypothetical protein
MRNESGRHAILANRDQIERRGKYMRRITTVLEIILGAALLIVGVYLLNNVILDQSISAGWMLLVGATVSALSLLVLAQGIRSIIWDRRMMRLAKVRRRSTERHREQISSI